MASHTKEDKTTSVAQDDNQPNVIKASIEAMRSRQVELQPAYDEYMEAKRILDLIDGKAPVERAAPRPRAPQPQGGNGGSSTSGTTHRRGGRRDQVLGVIRDNPGITVADIGKKLGMEKANYLYRVVADLRKEQAVREEGKGLAVA